MSVWLSNGEIVMDNGQIIVCDECPCTGTGTVLVPQPCEACPDGDGVANGLSLDVTGFTNNSGMPSGCSVCPGLDGTYLAPISPGNGCTGHTGFHHICTYGTSYWLDIGWSITASTPPYWMLELYVRIAYAVDPYTAASTCHYSIYRAFGTGNCFEIDVDLSYVTTTHNFFYCCVTSGLTIHATAY